MVTVQQRGSCGRRVPGMRRRLIHPRLLQWSLNLAEDHAPELSYPELLDFEREARISQLGWLSESPCATRLWRCICVQLMCSEIRSRSDAKMLSLELALQESLR